MIGAVLTDLGGRVDHADLVRVSDRTVQATLTDHGQTIVSEDESESVQLRVVSGGRTGWAGGSSAALGAVVEAALASAAVGQAATLFFPAPAPVPAVETKSPAAAGLDPRGLLELADRLKSLLSHRGWIVDTWAERSLGTVEVANTRGVHVAYDQSIVGIGADVRPAIGGPICRLFAAAAAPPAESEIDRLVALAVDRMTPPVLDPSDIRARSTVWFAPRAVRALLTPVLARLIGERWLTLRDTWPMLDSRLTIADDPLASGRPGSRPVCDDGVPSRRLTLVDRGRAVDGLLDLATASRHGLPATGHGWRRGYSAPRTGFTNLVVEPGEAGPADLARAAGNGLLVADLTFGPAPDPVSGVFRVVAPWTYRLSGGEIVGRQEGTCLTGDVFDLLRRVVAIGADSEWIGPVRIPAMVVDAVGVEWR